MDRRSFIAALTLPPVASALGCAAAREPVVGLPCEDCEAVFIDRPAVIAARVRIAPPGEPGTPMALFGRVVDLTGASMSGIVVYAYHTDRTGLYRPGPNQRGEAHRHGRLRAWARTDAAGRYRFDTIRPAGYPRSDLPEHVHLYVIEPGRATYYIDDAMFTDDPRLTARQRDALVHGRGGTGLCRPELRDGVWHARRDIVLGANIPGYRS